MERLINSKIPKIASTTSIISSAICVVAFLLVGIIDQNETKRLDAESVVLAANRTISYNKDINVSDFIEYLNGVLVDDYVIDTDTLGDHDISFRYINAH